LAILQKGPQRQKITTKPFCKSTTPAPRSCRWRAVATASLVALERKQTPSEREVDERRSQRTYLGSHHRQRAKQHHLLLHLHTPDPSPQIRPGESAPGSSKELRTRGERPLHVGAPENAAVEGAERRHQTPHRPRHRLQSAADRGPSKPYTIYTPRFGVPPPSRCRSGWWGRRNHRIYGGEVGWLGRFQKIALSCRRRRRNGPRSVCLYSLP
jgi:hypothetical protein